MPSLVLSTVLSTGLVSFFATGPLPAAAQEGIVPLRTGFIPDPAVLPGHAEGLVALGVEPAECGVGFFGSAPSHVLQLETRVGFLRFYATGPGDLALAVRDAEGRWHCNDDRFGRHPSVEGTWTPGRVEVWVGTHEPRGSSEYQLRLTETRSMRPGVGPDGGDAGDETALARDAGLEVDGTTGRFDGIRLRRGFLPDPRFLVGDTALPEGREGVEASVLGGECHGIMAGAPSHTIELLDELDFFQLYLLPIGADRWPADGVPTFSIAVLLPSGTFACDSGDAGRVDISASGWVPGLYRVWVGTEPGEPPQPYRLGVSEIRRVR